MFEAIRSAFRQSLRVRAIAPVFWALFIPALLFILCSCALLVTQYDQRVRDTFWNTGRLLTDGLSLELGQAVRPDVQLADLDWVPERLGGVYSRFRSIDRLLVTDLNAKILFDTEARPPDNLVPPGLRELFKAGVSDGKHLVDSVIPAVSSLIRDPAGQPIGYVGIVINNRRYESYTWALLAFLALPVSGLIVLAAVVCLWPARWLARSIEAQLSESTQQLERFVSGQDLVHANTLEPEGAKPVAGQLTREAHLPIDLAQVSKIASADFASRWRSLDQLEAEINRRLVVKNAT